MGFVGRLVLIGFFLSVLPRPIWGITHSCVQVLVDLHVRWMLVRDIPQVLEIQNQNGIPNPHSYESLEFYLTRDVLDGYVAYVVVDSHDQVLGYELYRLNPGRRSISALAVHPDFTGYGVGTLLIDHMVHLSELDGRSWIEITLDDEQVRSQMFAASHGFDVVRDPRFRQGEQYLYRRVVERPKPTASWCNAPVGVR